MVDVEGPRSTIVRINQDVHQALRSREDHAIHQTLVRVLGCRGVARVLVLGHQNVAVLVHQDGHILFHFLDGMQEQLLLRAMGAPRRASIGICSKEDELIVGSLGSLA